MPPPVKQTWTEEELRKEYHHMISIFASGEENWPQKLESYILAKGRTEMHHLIAYLFTKCVLISGENIELQKSQERILARLKELNAGQESEVPDPVETGQDSGGTTD